VHVQAAGSDIDDITAVAFFPSILLKMTAMTAALHKDKVYRLAAGLALAAACLLVAWTANAGCGLLCSTHQHASHLLLNRSAAACLAGRRHHSGADGTMTGQAVLTGRAASALLPAAAADGAFCFLQPAIECLHLFATHDLPAAAVHSDVHSNNAIT
jgi:hypothetical protein